MTVPLPRHNRVLLACLIFCLATLVVSHVSGFIGLDECHMDSLENGYAKGDVWLSAMRYLQFDLFCVFALAVTLALHDRHVLPLFDIAVAWIWYQSTYNILAAAKCWLGDTRCHKKGFANSVSGHFHFHVFALYLTSLLHGYGTKAHTIYWLLRSAGLGTLAATKRASQTVSLVISTSTSLPFGQCFS
eukprot:TRINITY_DN49609_c0_g1_i1.p2 TRINITY_DN49609_c0_g1~~TRINITY_DN49609_c0_g1_i1.p2  ORF type:complete len:202 (+),score=28.84 TRINITY_DN49609_c0_g1_i1:44-607(+)